MTPTISSRRAGLLAALAFAALASAPAHAGAKKYFMTVGTFAGDAVLAACGKGYHMASLWEIHDPTLLKYDTKRGLVRDDSGSGPPDNFFGWVRTGNFSSASANPGAANCNAWSSTAGGDYGTIVELSSIWDSPASFISPWHADVVGCDVPFPVWCKQN